MNEIEKIIKQYDLKPLPVEGTLFKQTYDSGKGTAIIGLYCNEPDSKSLFHKLTEDEIWHFYGGDPLNLILLYPDGTSEDVLLGNDLEKDQRFQFTVPAGVWQAGHLIEGGTYSLYGCTMAPGFKERMFTGGTEEELTLSYPDRADEIRKYACPPGQKAMPQAQKDSAHEYTD